MSLAHSARLCVETGKPCLVQHPSLRLETATRILKAASCISLHSCTPKKLQAAAASCSCLPTLSFSRLPVLLPLQLIAAGFCFWPFILAPRVQTHLLILLGSLSLLFLRLQTHHHCCLVTPSRPKPSTLYDTSSSSQGTRRPELSQFSLFHQASHHTLMVNAHTKGVPR